jgi:hypothetical protein
MRALLDFALHAHGGLERWRAVHSLDVRVSLTGGLYRLKGLPEGVPNGQITWASPRSASRVDPLVARYISMFLNKRTRGMSLQKRLRNRYTPAGMAPA